jgi:hypothetical protein
MKSQFIASLCLLSLFAACRTVPPTGDSKDATKDAAIEGLVLKGPIYPVERPGVINAAPLPGAPVTISSNSAVIAHVFSDSVGKFYVKVTEGTYTCTPESYGNSVLPRPEGPVTVQVPAHTVVRDTLHYDTGIR